MRKKLLILLVCVINLHFLSSQNPFISTWSTATPNAPVIIPTFGTGYNYDVDWDNDGIYDDIGVTGDITHIYPNAGTHVISIRGDFPRIYINATGSNNQLLSIDQWGDISWSSFGRAFNGCSNMVINATDVPDLSNVTDMSLMFRNCTSFNQSIDNWDVSNVTNMGGLFSDSIYNQPLNSWDVSNVTLMSNMFSGATSFNQPLDNWDVSNVSNMTAMFNNTTFNQPIGNWNVGNVTNMSFMFFFANNFNQPIDNWDVSSVTNMNFMFASSVFNQPLNSWNVSNVATMIDMFGPNNSFNQPLDNWDVSNVTNMSFMFFSCPAFNQPLQSWDVSSVTDMSSMFEGASAFNRRLGTWNVSNVTNMQNMFKNAILFNFPIINWDVSNVTNMASMFEGAQVFDQDIGPWNVSSVSDMTNMFLNAELSIINYDNLLFGWESLTLQPNVSFHAGTSQYCDADVERANIISTYGWTITDGGQTACSLSIEDIDNTKFSVYPNPTSSEFTVDSRDIIKSLNIYNIHGQLIKSFFGNQSSYDIEDLTSGIYFVTIKTADKNFTKKLIKE